MMDKTVECLNDLVSRYPALEVCKEDIFRAYCIMAQAYENNGKLLVAGNGGSAADAEHIVGELMKEFKLSRNLTDEQKQKLIEADEEYGKELAETLQQSLAAIALAGHVSLTTACLNDVNGIFAFAQQLQGYGRVGDVFLGITTSGNSKNVLLANAVAKAKGMKTIALTGGDGGEIKSKADVSIVVPEEQTYKIQELHLPIYHCLCLMLEEKFFGEE